MHVRHHKGLKVQDESAYQEINVMAFQMIFVPHLVKIFCIQKQGALPPQTDAHAADAADVMLHNGPKKLSQKSRAAVVSSDL